MIHDYSSSTIYLTIYFLIVTEYEMIIYETIHIPTRGE